MTTDDSGEPARRHLSGRLPRETHDPAVSQRRDLAPSVVNGIIQILLVVAYMVFAGVCTPSGTTSLQYPEVLVFTVSGAIAAHVLLFALWAGLGPGSVIRRVPLAAGACFLISSAEALGASRRPTYGPILAVEGIVGQMVLFCLFCLLLWSIRRGWGWQMTRHGVAPNKTDGRSRRIQFSLRLLLLWTTLAACVLALWRSRFSDYVVADEFLRWWQRYGLRFLLGILVLAAMLLIAVVVPWTTLAYHGKGKWAILAAGFVWGILTWGVVFMYSWILRWPLDSCVPIVVSFELGAGMAGFAAALILRLRGYRIVRFKKAGAVDQGLP